MKKYIGTKIISAEPFVKDGKDGYTVVYKDGYISWSPKEAFEEAYEAIDDIPNSLDIGYLESVIANIAFKEVEGTTTTLCILTLKNGYTVIGKSACIDKAAFNAEIGRDIAYGDAFEKIWELEGYRLTQHRFEAGVK
jgi:hypothetical protein